MSAGDGGDAVFEMPSLVAAAHELKAPLALIRQLSLELQASGSEERARQVATQIQYTTERALRLTTSLTKAARLEESLFDVQPLNPQQICEEVASEMAPLCAARNRHITVKAGQPALVIGHADLVRRILLSFVDNALHYAPSDSPMELRISRRGGGKFVRLSVRDYGPRVESMVWKKLCHTLGKSAQPMTIRPESSGLGLFIASEFAKTMNGQIGAVRHRDGATFFVDLQASSQLSLPL